MDYGRTSLYAVRLKGSSIRMRKRILLVCFASPQVGLGHLSRLQALVVYLNRLNFCEIELLVFSDSLRKKDSARTFKYEVISTRRDFISTIRSKFDEVKYCAVIFDLPKDAQIPTLCQFFENLKESGVKIIAIDCLFKLHKTLDLIWVPSFILLHDEGIQNIRYGWDCYLIKKKHSTRNWTHGPKVLVLTGGSDPTKLSNKLPEILDGKLSQDAIVTWVRGPFSEAPLIPHNSRLKWIVKSNPDDIEELIVNSNYAICTYGVSFFEVMQHGIPSVIFSPYGKKDTRELNVIKKLRIARVSSGHKEAVSELVSLMDDNALAANISECSKAQMTANGNKNLAETLEQMLSWK